MKETRYVYDFVVEVNNTSNAKVSVEECRYVVRFLKLNIKEDLKQYESYEGAPQGWSISPVLANVYSLCA